MGLEYPKAQQHGSDGKRCPLARSARGGGHALRRKRVREREGAGREWHHLAGENGKRAQAAIVLAARGATMPMEADIVWGSAAARDATSNGVGLRGSSGGSAAVVSVAAADGGGGAVLVGSGDDGLGGGCEEGGVAAQVAVHSLR